MTWSILARDPETGAFGAAVATKFFAVGALCIHAASGVGALATQALINPIYGPRGLALLKEGVPAAEVVGGLTGEDAGRDHRQLHVIDAGGGLGVHTGSACVEWCGALSEGGVSCAGNMLAGPAVLERTLSRYREAASLPFAQRLIAALLAGEAAGGDKRGRQSAALRIHGREEYPDLDLRVDDHADPLAELARLEAVSRERFVHFRRFLPTRERPAGIYDRNVIEAEIARMLAAERA